MSSANTSNMNSGSNQLTRKRAAPAEFDHVEYRTFPKHPAFIKGYEPSAAAHPDDPGVPLTTFGDPAFVSFNHRNPPPAVEEIVREQAVPDNRNFMCRLAGTMMSSVLAGLSGIGRKITHFFYNDPSYNIVERRNYDPRNGSWSNKRAKVRGVRDHLLDAAPPSSYGLPNPDWFNDDEEVEDVFATGTHYQNLFKILSAALAEYRWYDVDRDQLGHDQITEQLKWVETGLFDYPEEIRPLHDLVTQGNKDTHYKPNHWIKLKLVLDQVKTFLADLYDFDTIRDLRGYHRERVSHDYCHIVGRTQFQTESFIKNGTATKKLLSNEHFVALVIYLNHALNIPPPDRITTEMIKKILLDISAIENNLPPPTYIKGDIAQNMYRRQLRDRFSPIPHWMDLPLTDLNPLKSENLPGTFPFEFQQSSLYYYPNGRRKHVPNASRLPLPPPLPKRSGRGQLPSPSKSDDPEPMWHPINANRVEKPHKRCKVCKNMPHRCQMWGCNKWDDESPLGRFRAQQLRSPQHLHSPHHRVAPPPQPILKRKTNRHKPSQLIDYLHESGENIVTFSESTIDPPNLASPNNKASQDVLEDFDHELNNFFTSAFGTAEHTQQPSAESQDAIARAQEKARKEHEELLARELAEKLARTGGLRPPKINLVEDLPDHVMERIANTLHAAAPTTLATTGEGVELRSRDFGKVVPASEWLNDEIVNGALNWLDKAVNSAAGVKNPRTQTRKCAAFSSFFFKMLRDSGPRKGVRTLGRMGIKRHNFHEIDTLLLPICENSHWTLVVVRPSKKTVAHMDSLNPRGNTQFINLTYEWLKEFLQEDFIPEDWKTVKHEAPHQTNGWDCGVHTITNAMCLALGLNPIESYTSHDMRMQRLRVAGMLLNGGFHGDYSLQAF